MISAVFWQSGNDPVLKATFMQSLADFNSKTRFLKQLIYHHKQLYLPLSFLYLF